MNRRRGDLEEDDFVDNKWWLRWRHLAAYVYIAICLFDFIIMPSVFEIHNKIDPVYAVELALKFSDSGERQTALTILMNKRSWTPLTLDASGTFHIAFGAILGAAAWKRTEEKIRRSARRDSTRSAMPDNPDA